MYIKKGSKVLLINSHSFTCYEFNCSLLELNHSCVNINLALSKSLRNPTLVPGLSRMDPYVLVNSSSQINERNGVSSPKYEKV